MNELKRKNSVFDFFSGLDYLTILTAAASSVYGLLLVYSATYSALDSDTFITNSVLAMLITVAAGFLGALILSRINYEIISKLWPVIGVACVVLMIITDKTFGCSFPAVLVYSCHSDERREEATH